jgi:hypothetical protein
MGSFSEMLCDYQTDYSDNLPLDQVRLGHDSKGRWCLLVENDDVIEEEGDNL